MYLNGQCISLLKLSLHDGVPLYAPAPEGERSVGKTLPSCESWNATENDASELLSLILGKDMKQYT